MHQWSTASSADIKHQSRQKLAHFSPAFLEEFLEISSKGSIHTSAALLQNAVKETGSRSLKHGDYLTYHRSSELTIDRLH
jgi:hypothetical protein